MGCKVEFDRSSLHKRLGATFMKNEYKYIREIMLFDIEKGLFPATQLLLEKELEIENLQAKLGGITDKYTTIRTQKVCELNEYIKSMDTTTVCDAIHKYITMVEATNVDEKIQNESHEIEQQIINMRGSKENIKKTFIRKCSQTDCNGTLSHENRTNLDNYRCVLCKSISCVECREILVDEVTHKCNQETLDTIKFIDNSSKPCPSCASPIHKLAGCFDKNVIIPLINGINKYAQEIEIGDQLVGDDSQARLVLETFNGTDLLYQVDQEYGEPYVVNSRHNLVLTKYSGAQYTIDLTTYLELPKRQQDELYGYKIIAATGEKQLSKLSIKPLKVGEYYGFAIDGNHKFLYTDGTVLANCNQMFCTNCHVAFDWKTLHIATGVVHNPHYFEWQRQHGDQTRDPLDIQCGQEIDHTIIQFCQRANKRFVENSIDSSTRLVNISMNQMMNRLMEKIPHVHHVSIPRYQDTNIYARNQALRLQLLRKYITKSEFKMKIQRSDKAGNKKRDILNILVTYRDAATDITIRLTEKIRTNQHTSVTHFEAFYTEYYTLHSYVNQCLSEVARTYSSNMSENILDY
jgi:hypothetical protein